MTEIEKKQKRRRRWPWGAVMLVIGAAPLVLPGAAVASQATCQEALETPGALAAGGWEACQGLSCQEKAEISTRAHIPLEDWDAECVAEANREIEEEARVRAEEAEAKTKALGKPIENLSARAVPHPAECRQACEGASRNPGYTAIEITTAPFSYLTIKLVRYGHRTERLKLGAEESKVTVKVPWTCGLPGGVYHYTVSAHSNVGKALIRRGTFRPVSIARCHWLKHAVQAEREGNERIARERERETEGEERERLEQWESNCRALGDTPVVLHNEGSTIHVCRTPEGYTVEVPE